MVERGELTDKARARIEPLLRDVLGNGRAWRVQMYRVADEAEASPSTN